MALVLLVSVCPSPAEIPTRFLPSEVATAAREARNDAVREAVVPAEFAALFPPLGEPEPEPPPEWIYGNVITGAVARAVGGEEGLYQQWVRLLSLGNPSEAVAVLAEVRTRYPGGLRAGDAAFWMGELRRRAGRTEDAIALWSLVSGKRSSEGSYRLGWLLSSRGRSAEAKALWTRLASDANNSYRYRAAAALGATLVSGGQPEAARRALETVVGPSKPPPGPEEVGRYGALLPLAVARLLLGERVQAQKALLELLLDRPDHPAAPWASLVLAYAQLGDGDAKEALRRFNWVLEGKPSPELADRARLGLVLSHIDLLDPEAAADALSALDGRQPWFSRGRIALAWLHFQRKEAEASLRWADATGKGASSSSALAAYLTAESLRLLGRGNEALRRYDAVPAESPLQPASNHGKALVALELGNAEGARALLQSLLRDRPEYSGADLARGALAEACAALGQNDEARRAAEEISSVSPAFADALLLRATVASRKGRWGEEAALLDRFLTSYPSDPRSEEAVLRQVRAERKKGAARAALDLLDSHGARLTSPGAQAEGRVERGRLLAALGRDEEASAVLTRELAESLEGPRSAVIQEVLGELAAKGGQCAAAVPHFEAALGEKPGREVARDAAMGRARCLYALGRTEEALQGFLSVGDSADGFYGQALCLARLGRPEDLDVLSKVVGLFKQATEEDLDPRNPELEKLLAEAQLAAGRRLLSAGEASRALPLLKLAAASGTPAGVAALDATARFYDETNDGPRALESWDNLARRTEGRERAAALRAAARHAERSGDVDGARNRIARALEACPGSDVEGRQTLLADAGELELRAGSPAAAVAFLRRAGEAGFGPEGLRALRSLAEAQDKAGLREEALETSLRIGYLYGLGSPETAELVLGAATAFDSRGRSARAFALYQWVLREAPAPFADRARGELERLAAREGTKEPPPAP